MYKIRETAQRAASALEGAEKNPSARPLAHCAAGFTLSEKKEERKKKKQSGQFSSLLLSVHTVKQAFFKMTSELSQ